MKHKTLLITKNHFEKKAWADNLYACGIDEVGRGCLAGPVVVAAVILPRNTQHRLLKDSKIMSHNDRVQAYNWITQHCIWAVGNASHIMIDDRNIYQSTLYAMQKAYLHLRELLPFPCEQLRYVLIDAMPLSIDNVFGHSALTFQHFTHGETFSTSIAAASIVAKVTRDRLMERMAPLFPAFGLDQHKGYATQQHRDALKSHGATVIHRTTFMNQQQSPSHEKTLIQTTLF